MTMNNRHATPKEIQKAFDACLEHLQLGVPTDAGFDTQTYLALSACVADPTNETLKSRARVELRKQLGGKHDVDDGEDWDRALREARGN